VYLLGSPLDVVDMDQAVARCREAIDNRGYLQHMSVNASKLVAMREDDLLRDSVLACDLITADGQSVVWAARALGARLPERVAGIDLMERMLAAANEHGYGIYLLGARREVLDTAIERLSERYPNLVVAGSQDGYFDDAEADAVAAAISDSKADILFVAMSSPLKELFLGRYGRDLGTPFTMGVGGSVDVIAGLTKRAPVFMQRSGLEWLFRLAQEPRRLGRRYLTTNVRFAWLVVKAVWVRRSSRPCAVASTAPAAGAAKRESADPPG
jgi:N-acetylglucosaminyldiphosphoundecaprenol N-acetyl-beta-D-mannosaminyltransferase